ncbi:hypothetical protein OF820_08785 [Oceanotoga sp. DSM 15011]|uniref:acyltransferase n=1 Tax=Oceanotoga sp. DSM 15011 TaxID=2984951 RepID=UPI0021F46535|nr:hypothetical protein [Oceanotoga sp. DSM 15011]UYO99169.1 hypothetical protein OF820_08785 [Oceanotoga sp. DSM 15011]
MNSLILPNTKLGPHTVVGANSVVKGDFEQGYCVLAGNPAKVVKKIDKEKCIDYDYSEERIGYIKFEKFEKYRKKHLNL